MTAARIAPALCLVALTGAAVAYAKPRTPPPAPSASASASAPVPQPSSSAPSAVPPAPVNPNAQDVAKAKAVFEAGGRAFDQGDFDAAIQAFEQAYSMSGRPSILFSLAQAHKKRFVDDNLPADRAAAIDLYRAYLADVKTGGRRADAIKGLESLGASATPGSAPPPTPTTPNVVKRTQLAIDSPTPGAMISIDGGALAPPQVMAEVTKGRHTVRVSAPGYIEKEFVTQAVEGQIIPETYELEEEPAKLEIVTKGTLYIDGRDMGRSTVVTVPSGSHFISVAQSGHHSEARAIDVTPGQSEKLTFPLKTTTQRDASIGLMIGGSVVIVGGAVFLGLAFLRQAAAEKIQDKRDAGSITADELRQFEDASKERDIFRGTGSTIGVVGGLGALIGAALYLFDNPAPKTPPAETLGQTKKKEELKRKQPSDMEPLSFSPWVGPSSNGGVEVGGTWTAHF